MGSISGFVAPASEMAAGKSKIETRCSPRTRRALLLRKRLAFIQTMGRADARFVRFVHKLVRLIRAIEKVVFQFPRLSLLSPNGFDKLSKSSYENVQLQIG